MQELKVTKLEKSSFVSFLNKFWFSISFVDKYKYDVGLDQNDFFCTVQPRRWNASKKHPESFADKSVDFFAL